ncbi:hypothetical protein ACWEWD_38070 [Streptomyces tendae]
MSAARTDLVAFEEFMLAVLDEWGLPTDSIIVSAGDRHVLLKNTPDILGELKAEQLARSPYISKMILAGAAGLFDAALSYLWDETITQLRDRVADFDVACRRTGESAQVSTDERAQSIVRLGARER